MKTEFEKMETSKGFRVYIPDVLNDLFREAFPSAMQGRGHWDIGPRSGKKFDRWVEEITSQGVLEKLMELQETELTTRDQQRIKDRLWLIEQDIKAETRKKKEFDAILGNLDAANDALTAHENELLQLRRTNQKMAEDLRLKRDSLMHYLKGVIDFDRIQEAQDAMKRNSNRVGAEARNAYHNAQQVINGQRRRLAEAKLTSRGLDLLYGMNFNRPDRDNPDSVTLDDILQISDHI